MKKALAVLLSVALGLVLAVGGVELASRARLLPCVESPPNAWEPHPQFGWFHRPGVRSWGQGCARASIDWRSFVEFNEQGLRDDVPQPYEKPPGVFRILLLGDSFTEGFTVDLDDHFAPELERRLSDMAGRPVEVLNSGVSAWGTAQELLYYRLEGDRFSPDLVLLLFNPDNDIRENVPGIMPGDRHADIRPRYELVRGRLKVENFPVRERANMPGSEVPLEDVLERYTQAYPVLRQAFAKLRQVVGWSEPASGRRRGRPTPPVRARAASSLASGSGPDVAAAAEAAVPRPTTAVAGPPRRRPMPPGRGAGPGGEPPPYLAFSVKHLPPRWQRAWLLTQALVDELRRRVEANGSRFAVAVVGSKFAVKDKIRSWGEKRLAVDPILPQTRAVHFLASRGIPTCPLLPAFRENYAKTGRTGFHVWDIHWDAVGHAVVAAELAKCLRDLGLVPLRDRAPSS